MLTDDTVDSHSFTEDDAAHAHRKSEPVHWRAACFGLPRGAVPYLIKFLDVMRGCLMAAPSKLDPVMKMPLHEQPRSADLAAWAAQHSACTGWE